MNSKDSSPDFEEDVIRALSVPKASAAFVDQVYQRLIHQASHTTKKVHPPFWQRRSWQAGLLTLGIVSALVLWIGPQRVYAHISNLFSWRDPGLDAIQQQDLVTEVHQTVLPAFLPSPTPAQILKPFPVGLSQTQENITITLGWAYLDEGRLGLMFHFDSLPEDSFLDIPQVQFKEDIAHQPNGSIKSFHYDDHQAVYASFQVIQSVAVDGRVDLSVDLPLQRLIGGQSINLANFHFDVSGLSVFTGQTLSFEQTYAVRHNGLEIRLKSVRVTPTQSEIVVCYDVPSSEISSWNLRQGMIQFNEAETIVSSSYQVFNRNPQDHCVQLSFDAGSVSRTKHLTFWVDKLVTESLDDEVRGPWKFSIDLPDAAVFGGQSLIETVQVENNHLSAQTQSDVTVTLDWVFVDALRAAVGYTIRGLPDQPEANILYGHIALKDNQGNYIGGAGVGTSEIARVAGQPGVLKGSYSVGFREPFTDPEAQFQLEMRLDGSQDLDLIAFFPTTPDSPTYPPGVFPPRLPEGYVGSYQFDFTAKVHPLTDWRELPPVEMNGVIIQVAQAQLTSSMSKISLCYIAPSSQDWWITNAILNNGIDQANPHSGSLLYDSDLGYPPEESEDDWRVPAMFKGKEHARCVTANFLLGLPNRDTGITLTIPYLEIPAPEVIPDAEIQVAHEKLKEKGIELVYATAASAGGGGGGGIIFSRLPEGMSQEEAYLLYRQALGYIHTGPWNLPLQPAP